MGPGDGPAPAARHRARADEILLREVERPAPAARPLLHRGHGAWAEVMAVVLGAVHHVDVRETRGARLQRLDEIAQHRRIQRLRLGHALGMVRARAVEDVRDLGKPVGPGPRIVGIGEIDRDLRGRLPDGFWKAAMTSQPRLARWTARWRPIRPLAPATSADASFGHA